jgi:hypothetical protein
MENIDLITYFNYGFLAVIALSVLLGFWFGAFRSIYFFAGFFGLFVIGWFLSPILARVLFTFDLSALGSVGEVELSTIEGMIPSFLDQISPNMGAMFAPGSSIYELGTSAILMVLRLVAFLAWLLIVMPIMAIILWVIYLFVKPKGKKSLTSRLIGSGVSALHGLLFLFIISIFFTGVTSIANSALTLTEIVPDQSEQEEASPRVIFTSAGPMLEVANPDFEQFDFVIDFAKNYRKTYVGAMSGLIKIDKAGLDEFMFDELFSLKYKDTKIKFRKELATALHLYSLIAENVSGEINLESLLALDDDVKTEIVEGIKKLKILQVAIPVGIEYVVTSGILQDQMGELDSYIDLEEIMPQILEIDFEDEIGYLAAAVLDALALGLHNLGDNTEILLTLDGDTVDSLLNNIGSLALIDIVGTQLLTAFANSEKAREFYAQIGFTDQVNMNNVQAGAEIRNLGNIYRAFAALGITTTDFNEIDFSKITAEHINALGEAIFGSTLFSNNGRLLASALVNQLPEEYRSYLTVNQFELNDFTSIVGLGLILFSVGFFDEGSEIEPKDLLSETNIEKIAGYISNSDLLSHNIGGIINMMLQTVELPEGLTITIDSEFDWSGESGRAEMIALFTATNKLLELGIADNEDFLSNLNAEKIEELSDALAESQIFRSNIGNFLNYFLTNPEITGGLEFTIREIDWTSEAGKTEFKALFEAIAAIYELNLLGGEVDLTAFTDEQIDKLAKALSSSIIIRDNLSNIILQVTSETIEFEIAVFTDPDEWTEHEIGSLLRAARIIAGKDNILVPSDEEVEILLSSNLIVDSVILLLEKYTAPDGDLHDLLIIDGITDWRDTYEGETRIDGELRRFFTAARILLGDDPDMDDPESMIDLNRLLNLSDGSVDPEDDDWGKLLSSQVLKKSLINQLIKYGTDKVDEHGNVIEEAMLVVKLPADDPRWDTELRDFFCAVKTVLGDDTDLNNFNIDPNILLELTTGAPDEESDEVGDILSSIIVTDTIVREIIRLGSGEDSEIVVTLDVDDPAWYDTDDEPGEIRKLIMAIKIIFSEPEDDLNNPQFDANRLLGLSDGKEDPEDDDLGTILSSQIIKDTIIHKLIKLSAEEDAVLVVKLTADDFRWDEELRAFFGAVKIILGDSDLENFDFDPNILLGLTTGTPGEGSDEVGEILDSIIVTDTIIKQIIELGEGEDSELVVNLDAESPLWYDSETESGEIRKMILAIKIVFSGPDDDLNNPEIDPNIIFELSDGRTDPDDDELGTVLSSIIISDTIINKLIELGEGEDAVLVVDLPANDPRWYDSDDGPGEIKRLVFGAKILLGEDPDLNNPEIISQEDLLRLGEDDIDTLLDSLILSRTMVKEIKNVDSLVIPDELQGPENEHLWYDTETEEGELRKLIRVAKLMLADGSSEIDTDKILNLNDDDIDVILESLVMKATIKSELYNVEGLVINETHPDFYWDDRYEGGVRIDGELRKLLKAAPLIIENEEADIDKLLDLGDGTTDVNGDGVVDEKDDQIAILVASRIIVDTAVRELKTMTAEGGSLYEVLYLPVDAEVEYHGPDGEMRKFIIAIKHIAAANTEEGEGISDISDISISSLTDPANRDKIIASKIIATTLIINIENEADKPDSALVLAPELDRDNLAYDPDEWDTELPKFLDAIYVIVGDSNIDEISFDSNAFLNISDSDIDVIVASRVISYSIIKQLEEQHINPNSPITIPEEFGSAPEQETNEALWYEGGELRRTLRALRELGMSDYEEKFPLQAVFAEARGDAPEVILASKVVENTIITRIDIETAPGGSLEGTLVYPEDWQHEDWYGPEGELRKFLVGLEVIVGPAGDLEDAEFSANRFLDEDRDKLLNSRLIEASAVEYIIASADPVDGDLRGTLYLPADLQTNNTNWYRTGGGELDRFLDAIKIIVGEDDYDTANFTVDTILGSDRETLLESRVVEYSAITYIKDSDKLTIPDASQPKYYYFADEDIVWERTYENGVLTDIGELRKFLNAIDYILGGTSDYDTFEFDMDNFLAIEDFTVILASRVLETTLADMIEDLLVSDSLSGFIKTPDNGYQWYYHATSDAAGLTGEVRRGEYVLTETTFQYSDLAGFLDAIKFMNEANLYYDDIDAYAIADSVDDDTDSLASALWDYSRIMRGSIATMLNEAIDRAIDGVSLPGFIVVPYYDDEDFDSKEKVVEKLEDFANFINLVKAYS